jgi:carbamoyltransferase
MIVLGINPGFDGTAALMVDGSLVAAVAEERLSRIKGHQGFPHRAIAECMRIGGIDGKEIDFVAFASRSFLTFSRYFTELMLSGQGTDFSNSLPFETRILMLRKDVEQEIVGPKRFQSKSREFSRDAYKSALEQKGILAPVIAIDHHLAHAASAYFFSPKDPALVITADGTGDGLGATAYIGKRGRLRKIASTPSQHAPGSYYSAVTSLLGFKRHRHEGKVLGLAAMGNPEATQKQFEKCLGLSRDRLQFRVPLAEEGEVEDLALKRWLLEKGFYLGATNYLLQRHMEERLASHTREDIAAGAQAQLERVFLDHVSALLQRTGMSHVALAGGVFANVILNQKILDLPGVESVSIHPNMGDGGLAVGAACVVTAGRNANGNGSGLSPRPLGDVFLGPSYSRSSIRALLRGRSRSFTEPSDLPERVARLLSEEKVVGVFQGRMEYGPRALGNRTILANPLRADIKDVLNHRLRRTEFMPFAPILRSGDLDRYFHHHPGAHYAMKFMTITSPVTREAKKRSPGVVHVDGTARPQIIENGFLSEVIGQFEKKTGTAILVNTSFNIHEEPIVCTPEDALRCFEEGSLDALVIEGMLLLKDPAQP